jgi:CRISPR-associated exonuclease Cas4
MTPPFALAAIDLRALPSALLRAGLPVLAGLVLLAWLYAFVRARAAGVPLGARIVAVDRRGWQVSPRSYVSARLGLSGRPDYIVAQRGRLIPVEAKPGRRGVPRPWDVLQLGAYLLLIEEETGQRPPYGVLAYREGGFRIRNTRRLRREVQAVVAQVRAARQGGLEGRQRRDRGRCRACGYRGTCGRAN